MHVGAEKKDLTFSRFVRKAPDQTNNNMNLLVLFNADVSVGPRIYLGTYLVSIVYN